METIVTVALLFVSVLIARANYLYGRSAYEAGEYGGPLVPMWLSELLSSQRAKPL